MAGEPIQRNEILVAYKQKEYREKMKRDGSGMEKKKYILLDVGGTEIKGSVSMLLLAKSTGLSDVCSLSVYSGQFCKDLPGTDERSRRKCCRSWDGDSGSV